MNMMRMIKVMILFFKQYSNVLNVKKKHSLFTSRVLSALGGVTESPQTKKLFGIGEYSVNMVLTDDEEKEEEMGVSRMKRRKSTQKKGKCDAINDGEAGVSPVKSEKICVKNEETLINDEETKKSNYYEMNSNIRNNDTDNENNNCDNGKSDNYSEIVKKDMRKIMSSSTGVPNPHVSKDTIEEKRILESPVQTVPLNYDEEEGKDMEQNMKYPDKRFNNKKNEEKERIEKEMEKEILTASSILSHGMSMYSQLDKILCKNGDQPKNLKEKNKNILYAKYEKILNNNGGDLVSISVKDMSIKTIVRNAQKIIINPITNFSKLEDDVLYTLYSGYVIDMRLKLINKEEHICGDISKNIKKYKQYFLNCLDNCEGMVEFVALALQYAMVEIQIYKNLITFEAYRINKLEKKMKS